MSYARAIGRQVIFGTVVQFLVSVRGLVVMPLIVKMSGETTFGTYVLLSSFVLFLGGISSFGTNYSYRRALPNLSDPADRRRILMPQLVFRLGVFCGLGLLVILFGKAILSPFIKEDFSTVGVTLWLAGFILADLVTDYYRYTVRFSYFNVITLTKVYVFIVAVFITVFLTRSLSINTLLFLQGGSLIAVMLPLLVLGVLRETGVEKPRLVLGKLVADARIGLPLVGEFVVDFLVASIDRYLIGIFLSVAAIGQYQAGYSLATLVIFLPRLLGVVLPPPLCRLWDAGRRDEAVHLASQTIRFFLILAIPFVVGTFLVGPSMVALLTTPDIALHARWISGSVSVAMVFYGLTIIVSNMAFITRQTRLIFTVQLVAVGVNVLVNLSVLPFCPDITVPALASVVAYGGGAFLALRGLRKTMRLSISGLSLIRAVGAALIMAVPLILAGFRPGQVEADGVIWVIGSVLVAVGVYFAAFVGLGGLSRQDLKTLSTLLKRSA